MTAFLIFLGAAGFIALVIWLVFGLDRVNDDMEGY